LKLTKSAINIDSERGTVGIEDNQAEQQIVGHTISTRETIPLNNTQTVDSPPIAQQNNPKVFLKYSIDPLRDRYQLGRAVRSSNDFIIPGHLHVGEDGTFTGPISRWACRIECERVPPFRSFIYAGGFDMKKVIISF
jgi:hypothetical protein